MSLPSDSAAEAEVARILALATAPTTEVKRIVRKPKVAPKPKVPTPPPSDSESSSDSSDSESEAESEAAPVVAAAPKNVTITFAEWNRLREVEKFYKAMKEKEAILKAKRNESSKKSHAKKTKEIKEVKAKLEERVEKLEKAVLKTAEEVAESESEAE
tara:strand:- start:249 stop:722 length:474 start_codon:yes stop_codon:yes gene_type:complete